MPIIQCLLGASTNYVNGRTYSFERDKHGRFVADVHAEADVPIFTSVEHFVIVDKDPQPAPPAPPLGLSGAAAPSEQSADLGDSDQPGAAGGEGAQGASNTDAPAEKRRAGRPPKPKTDPEA